MNYLHKLIFAGTMLCLVTTTKAALADTIAFRNTGEAADGSLLPIGSTDPNYTIVYASDGGSYTAMATTPNGAWATPTSLAEWISPGSSGNQSWNGGYYVYETTLNLTGYDPNTAVLSGSVAADNHLFIYLNGQDVSNSTSFNALIPFSLSNGFIDGINTVDFVVGNDGGPTGLLVENTNLYASPTPEPSSVLLLGTGLLVSAGATRRRFI